MRWCFSYSSVGSLIVITFIKTKRTTLYYNFFGGSGTSHVRSWEIRAEKIRGQDIQ